MSCEWCGIDCPGKYCCDECREEDEFDDLAVYKRKYRQNPEVREKMREYCKRYYSNPINRKRKRDRERKYNRRPEVKARRKAYLQRPEIQERRRIYYQEYWAKRKSSEE